jgi:triosephosphate isomerase
MVQNDPKIIINFKTYIQGMGQQAVRLARLAQTISNDYDVYIGIVPQFTDLHSVVQHVDIPVFAQHIDVYEPGSHTGHVLPEAVAATGVVGTLLNHSERQLNLKDIEVAVQRCREANLISIVCADTPEKTVQVAAFQPDMVAIEPPELIGTGIPVSQAQPEIVENTVSMIREQDAEIQILCGAGITTGDDVAAALALGTQGVLLASGVVKAKDPVQVLIDLVQGTKSYGH